MAPPFETNWINYQCGYSNKDCYLLLKRCHDNGRIW